ncbi:putative lipid-binding transport protein (Tim44 family) [Tepidamorphus gemmatus]|jgi:predicted lipid-binding transport protein (Tim44 family)|uniref:Putative lipid-binding transport protein (Tim44 family) n=1 Tax=Tepidamorphus gemmatus TaxID=747076 RepID=A0A4R3MEI9_9HYPH|nr:Tim44/TimA family putative adaptor protein [Tepidamorphus gemmatus]TCT11906.1 putative lipid-binding transport protein (Tim44 family) [Tepidamorphus gemmatus]
MNGFFDFYTILFLVLAVVIFLRLRSVLGRRTGSERPPFDPYSPSKPNGAASDKVIALPQRDSADAPPASEPEPDFSEIAKADSDLGKALAALRAADRSFDPKRFIEGAKLAYEMIVTAFAEGDRKTLKNLLSREVYDGFVAAIADRESRGETVTSNFVAIDKAEITEAALRGRTAQITVRFVSQLITATRDKDGTVIQGDPNAVAEVTDIWTFARDVGSRDPNWKLVATESAE